MSDALTSLDGTYETIWRLLEDGAKSKTSAASNLVLATASKAHGPSVRIVVLRDADQASEVLRIFTHAASRKVIDLNDNERAEILVWDPEQQFQIRLSVSVRMSRIDDKTWESLGTGTRLNYAIDPAPGTPIARPEIAQQASPHQHQMLALDARIRKIETLHISPDGLKRAVFENGTSQWIAP
ncbi:pyridoxamine 5'-phosphate oxidase family protein [Boseongicola aestuarii]|uniref:Pyridoxamine 5'-phosphate oxidase n=1 Tax=Boseongicola aestuarii TaxID=1470561 RepID=A0A238IZM8_9RHOB|nr:pyridoxamine 5'-phosphate oxidase family protein [Boseongicola aestuarii]SMX23846.1 pyridoxamine 5'-phosphate oxidase [Boseongicola aestuarii]